MLYALLVREYGFPGSYQAVRRYLRRQRGPAPVQATRRIETLPGLQAQHDWFEFEADISGARQRCYGLMGTLAHCRVTTPSRPGAPGSRSSLCGAPRGIAGATLQRPGLGRRLDPDSREALAALANTLGGVDAVLVVAAGVGPKDEGRRLGS